MGWFCSECCCFRHVAGHFEAGDGVVVTIVDNVGNIDGSVDIVNGDMAGVCGDNDGLGVLFGY